VKVTCAAPTGREFIAEMHFPGDLIGAQAVIAGKPAFGTSTTLEPSRLVRCSSREFRSQMADDPTFSSWVTRALSNQAFRLYERLASLGLEGARERLKNLLVLYVRGSCGNDASPSRVNLPLRDWELAAYLSITPYYLSRLWRELEREGFLSRRKGWIHLRDTTNTPTAIIPR